MLNVVAIEGVLLSDPRKITSKQDETKFYAFMEFGVPPYDINKKWLIEMINSGRKTGYLFINGITISGWPTRYALQNLKRGDLVGVVGSLSMMNSKEARSGEYIIHKKAGIRIKEIQKIMGNALKSDRSKIQRAPTVIGSPQQYKGETSKDHEKDATSYGIREISEKENGILDDTEFNFED